MQRIDVDGSPERVEALTEALRAALAGGPAVGVQVDADPTAGVALVVATSGSSGEPKLVGLSALALRASAVATADRIGGAASWLLALPAGHIAGVQVIVRSLLAGSQLAVQELRGGFDAAGFARAAAQLGTGRRATSLVPTQLRRLLDTDPATLCSFDAVLVGGAALDPALRERALAAGVAVVTTYGMSETAGGCVYDGAPLDGVRVALGPDDRVRLGGPTLAEGYLGEPDDRTFHRGWFHTGDLGRLRNGRLEILGRADDVIITGGENVAPAAVERVLLAQPGVSAACVVGIPDVEWGQAVAAAVVGPVAGLQAAVRAELGRAAVPRVLHAIEEIPLRGIGKPDRVAVAALLRRVTTPSGRSLSAD